MKILKWIAIGSVVFLILIIVLVVSLPSEGEATSKPTVTEESAKSASDAALARTNNLNEQLEENFYMSTRIQRENAQLILTVSDLWYSTPEYLQDRVVNDWIGFWTLVAGNNGWTGLARVQFVDTAGKQLAYKSRTIK